MVTNTMQHQLNYNFTTTTTNQQYDNNQFANYAHFNQEITIPQNSIYIPISTQNSTAYDIRNYGNYN